jgi:predicted transporter
MLAVFLTTSSYNDSPTDSGIEIIRPAKLSECLYNLLLILGILGVLPAILFAHYQHSAQDTLPDLATPTEFILHDSAAVV